MNNYFAHFKDKSPLWKMINKKEQFGLKEKGLIEKTDDSRYYEGYADACGELMEQIEDFFANKDNNHTPPSSKFKQEFMPSTDNTDSN